MSLVCTSCGSKIPDGSAFCDVCGEKTFVEQEFCNVCGAVLKPGAKFCRECGSQTKLAAAQPKLEPETPERVTMDELIPPVITDDMFSPQRSVYRREGDPSFDEAEGSAGSDPAADIPQPPQPTPEEIAAASMNDSFAAKTPTVADTPVIDDSFYSSYSAPQTEPVIQPAPTIQSAPEVTPAQPQQPVQQSEASQEEEGGWLVPAILFILILAVIAVDIFVLKLF